MQGAISQTVGLTLYANEFLRTGNSATARNFWPASSEFQFCEYVKFVDITGRGENGEMRRVTLAEDPLAWFDYLKASGIHTLHYANAPVRSGGPDMSPRMTAGFVGGGGRWLIEAVGPDGAELWEGVWEIGDKTREDRKIWQVTYLRFATGEPCRHKPITIATARNDVSRALEAALAFAQSKNISNFAACFQKGLDVFSAPEPLPAAYSGAAGAALNLPLPVRQLWGACSYGWVFGGMGSWNDMGFEGDEQQRYELYSDALYAALLQGVFATANWHDAPVQPVPVPAEPLLPASKGLLSRLFGKKN